MGERQCNRRIEWVTLRIRSDKCGCTCQEPSQKMRISPTTSWQMLRTVNMSCSPLIALINRTSAERNSVSAPAEFSSSSKYPISCLSRCSKQYDRRRRTRCAPVVEKQAPSMVPATTMTAP
eukprot:7098007-Prymnesium_polylepis.2